MTANNQNAFKLKAEFFPITVIKLIDSDQESVQKQLEQTQQNAPNYFNQSPIIIDASDLKKSLKKADWSNLCDMLRHYQLIPVGIKGLPPKEEKHIKSLSLPIWQQRTSDIKTEEHIDPIDTTTQLRNLVITKPIRSGMRVYAKQSNLVILAPVSSGAECIADGDINCYAPVRGRLLAGANGDQQAQIFCQGLEAELVSIAGYYLTYEECPELHTGIFHIYLQDKNIKINNFPQIGAHGVKNSRDHIR